MASVVSIYDLNVKYSHGNVGHLATGFFSIGLTSSELIKQNNINDDLIDLTVDSLQRATEEALRFLTNLKKWCPKRRLEGALNKEKLVAGCVYKYIRSDPLFYVIQLDQINEVSTISSAWTEDTS